MHHHGGRQGLSKGGERRRGDRAPLFGYSRFPSPLFGKCKGANTRSRLRWGGAEQLREQIGMIQAEDTHSSSIEKCTKEIKNARTRVFGEG